MAFRSSRSINTKGNSRLYKIGGGQVDGWEFVKLLDEKKSKPELYCRRKVEEGTRGARLTCDQKAKLIRHTQVRPCEHRAQVRRCKGAISHGGRRRRWKQWIGREGRRIKGTNGAL